MNNKTQDSDGAAGTSEKFDQWAIVELMGHRKIAGRVTEQIIAGVPLLRIDVPTILASDTLPVLPGYTQFYGASSIYCLTPTTEQIALRFTAYKRERPIASYELPQLKAAPAVVVEFPNDEDEDGEQN